MRVLRLSLAAVLLAACTEHTTVEQDPAPAPTQAAPQEPSAPVTEEPAAPVDDQFELFGDPLDKTKPAADFADIVANPDKYNGKEIVTEGTVRASCQERGCWMEVRPDADRAAAGATVRFKDYGFFVPLDSRGAKVTMQAIVKITILTPEQVAEYERDGQPVSGKLPDGSAKMLLVMASGVEMRGRKGAQKK